MTPLIIVMIIAGATGGFIGWNIVVLLEKLTKGE